MKFQTGKDIEIDIKNRLSEYVKDNSNNLDLNRLKSIVWVYLQELKIRFELESFNVSEIVDDTFHISYTKDNKDYKFTVSSVLEMRSIKIEKIKLNKVVKTYII